MIDCPVSDPLPRHRDPVNPAVNNMRSPDGKGAGQTLRGTQASGTQMRRGGLTKR